MPNAPQIDPLILNRVAGFRRDGGIPNSPIYQAVTRAVAQAATGGVTIAREEALNDLARGFQDALTAPPPQPTQNPMQSTLLSWIPIIGPLINTISGLIPGVSEYVSTFFTAAGDLIQGRGFDLGRVQAERTRTHIDNATMQYLGTLGIPANMPSTARTRLLARLDNPASAPPITVQPDAAPGALTPPPASTPVVIAPGSTAPALRA